MMSIRRADPKDRDELLDIWLRSVRATHTFLSADDIAFFTPYVREYLASDATDLWVLCADTGALMGFMGMTGSKIDAMFLAPEFLRQGGGRLLIAHARALHGDLTVDVNEQNPDACRFYRACGFVVTGRSELDDTGRPFPLLHLRLAREVEGTGP